MDWYEKILVDNGTVTKLNAIREDKAPEPLETMLAQGWGLSTEKEVNHNIKRFGLSIRHAACGNGFAEFALYA